MVTIVIVSLLMLLHIAFGLYIFIFTLGGIAFMLVDMNLGTVGEESMVYRFMKIIRFPFARWFA